jgi:DNA repair protein RadC
MPKVNEPDQYASRITDWPIEERPRERLMKEGAEGISSAELIAILLGQGTRKYNAVDLARKLLRKFGSLEALSDASLDELTKVDGIGPAKALTLLAAFQLYRNMQKERAENEIKSFQNPSEVAKIYIPRIGHLKQETFYVILLDSSLKKIRDYEVTQGILDASLVHPREVFKPAIRYSARGIIVLHNHPSGELKPSDQDIKTTGQLVESGKILGIPVYDHLIITQEGFYSFKEHGMIR